ncbi:MAG: hypothetical protein WD963_01845 [Candidatus Paceibacterota bacterium]
MENSLISRPIPVAIISWLSLLGGLLSVIGSAMPMFMYGTGFGFFSTTLSYLFIGGILLFISSFGLSKMRKWGLYLFTFWVVLGVAWSFYAYINLQSILPIPGLLLNKMLPNVIPFLAVIYLWTINKKFN